MTNNTHLTPDAVHMIETGVLAARQRHNPYISLEHLLLGALDTELVKGALAAGGSSATQLLTALNAELGMVRDTPLDQMKGLSRDAERSLTNAIKQAADLKHNFLNGGHLLLVILKNPDPFIQNLLDSLPPIHIDAVESYIQSHSEPPSDAFLAQWRSAKWEYRAMLNGVGHISPSGNASTARRNIPIAARQTVSAPRQTVTTRQNQSDPLWLYIGGAIILLTIYAAIAAPHLLIAFGLVVVGWIFSVSLHEFGHALVAYWGGDYTVVQKGYLTMNPLKYTHPLTTFGFPMLFLLMGGFGLPGGAVYIERHRLRNKWWGAAVSAAGPFANLICLVIFASPFWTGYVTVEVFWENETLWAAVAFLAWLQATSIVINLLPIPPLDGFGIIEPFLPVEFVNQMYRTIGNMGFLILIFIFFTPLGGLIFNQADSLTDVAMTESTDLDYRIAYNGLNNFRFWIDD